MLNLISLLRSRWALVWRSHKFRYGLSRALFGRNKPRQFYCSPCALRLLASKQLQPVRLIFDSGFRNEIAMRERAMTDSVERVRRIPGDVTCGRNLLVNYRAGKPFVVDAFNVQQRILAGALAQGRYNRPCGCWNV